MPKQHTITTYTFDELSDKAKKKAIVALRQSESENLPTSLVTEAIAEKCRPLTIFPFPCYLPATSPLLSNVKSRHTY